MLLLSSKTIRTVKISFHMVFISIITFDLLRRAFFSLPSDWLFFLTSGAVENFLCALIAYVLYYVVFKSNGNWKKIGFSTFFIIIQLLLATLKDYRIHDGIAFEQTFEYFTSFLGQSLLFYLFIYTFKYNDYFQTVQPFHQV